MTKKRGITMTVRCRLSTLMGTYRYQIKDVHEKTGLSRATISKLYSIKFG